VITACLGLIKSTSTQYDGGVVAIDSEKEFYRLQGDLYSLCRAKASFNNHLCAVDTRECSSCFVFCWFISFLLQSD
jgi:hypothetical protein